MENPSKPEKSRNRFWYLYGLILLAIFGASLALRVFPMQSAVFGAGSVNLQGPDGIYHLRLVENLLQHFPFRISFDPYTFFPSGQAVAFAPLYDYLAGFVAWVVGLGSPSQHTIEVVAAYFPAVLGSLVTVPVYFIGKTLWNRTAGLIAASIVGILPGTFLFRSRLGYFDHHVAEVFFSTLFLLCLLLTLRYLNKNPFSFNAILNKNWKTYTRPLLFSALTGIVLGLYLLVWIGGLLFVFLFFCWLVVMFILEHLRKRSTDYLCLISVPVFLLGLLTILPFLNQILYSELEVFSLAFGLIASLVLFAVSKFMQIKKLGGFFYPLALVGLGLLGILLLYLLFPALFHSLLNKFSVFKPDTSLLTVAEAKPWLTAQGTFTLAPIWNEFALNGIVAPIAFIILVVGLFKKISAEKVLLLLWSVLILCATLGQMRFAYYLAVIVALLSGYFYSEIISLIKRLFDRLYSRPSQAAALVESRSKPKLKGQAKLAYEKQMSARQNQTQPSGVKTLWPKLWAISISAILVFLLGVFPVIKPAIAIAGSNAGINSEWRDSLLWLKDNTPDPFQDPAYYYQLYQKPVNGPYLYPKSAYGVMAWWDYGHLITEIAHRIPYANPNQSGAVTAAQYFISQDEAAANKILDQSAPQYVIIDYDIAIPFNVANGSITGQKFYAMPTWAGTAISQYYDIYYQQKSGKLYPVPMYYPDYYYCLSTRLYNFHGAAVVPNNSTTVISFTQDSGVNVIQTSQTFATYEEASQFLNKQTSGNYRLVGTSPFSSPVPLEKLTHYQEVYKSPSGVSYNDKITNSSYIEIFKYNP